MFELLDEDGSNDISAEEFESFGFLFNFQGRAVRQIFREFDVSGDQVSTSRPKAYINSSVSPLSCFTIDNYYRHT